MRRGNKKDRLGIAQINLESALTYVNTRVKNKMLFPEGPMSAE